jgi:hypothetical protein
MVDLSTLQDEKSVGGTGRLDFKSPLKRGAAAKGSWNFVGRKRGLVRHDEDSWRTKNEDGLLNDDADDSAISTCTSPNQIMTVICLFDG